MQQLRNFIFTWTKRGKSLSQVSASFLSSSFPSTPNQGNEKGREIQSQQVSSTSPKPRLELEFQILFFQRRPKQIERQAKGNVINGPVVENSVFASFQILISLLYKSPKLHIESVKYSKAQSGRQNVCKTTFLFSPCWYWYPYKLQTLKTRIIGF